MKVLRRVLVRLSVCGEGDLAANVVEVNRVARGIEEGDWPIVVLGVHLLLLLVEGRDERVRRRTLLSAMELVLLVVIASVRVVEVTLLLSLLMLV